MRNKAINTLKYTGIVTLSQYIGSKKVKIAQRHNTGGNPLFDFLSDCLVGDFTIARATRPTKIMILKRSNPEAALESVSGFYTLLTKPEKVSNSTQSIVRYSFSIARDQLETIVAAGGSGSLYIGLYYDGVTADDITNYSAICQVNLAKEALVNSALVVDWELAISNNVAN